MKLDTRAARLKLRPAAVPYWRPMGEGSAVGYRRLIGDKPGTWTARRRVMTDGKLVYELAKLGTADDYADADGSVVLSWSQAQQKGLAWFTADRTTPGPNLLVSEAVDAYVKQYKARSNRATKEMLSTINTHVLPRFGSRLVRSLTTADLNEWLNELAIAAPRRRRPAPRGLPRGPKHLVAPWSPDTPDALRKRRSTANRIWSNFRAILNLAFRNGRVESDLAWRRVKPFANASEPRVRYLTDDQYPAFVQACEPDFQAIVIGALLTGADYGELRTARVRAFDPRLRTLDVSA
ncbi:MAG TPA: hypothetical protein VK726_23480, partial [Acetobacteraceae bacterium]|nr:hypothetical protein [Acetobacteraceae bacterium]